MCVCVGVCVRARARVCMYSIIHGPLLGICAIVILHVDLPLCKHTFVHKPGRNIIPALSLKIKIRALEILYNKGR